MPVTLLIRNETLGPSATDRSREWEFSDERITVRELIRRWVYEEVGDCNLGLRDAPIAPGHQGWVRLPDDGGARRGPELDWRREFEVATRAYEQRRILVLAGPRQTESLDEVVLLRPETEIVFLQLTEIVGR